MGSVSTRTSKSVRLPGEGDYLTDGKRLVEVVGKSRNGFKVLDVCAEIDEDGSPMDADGEVLNPTVALSKWRIVEPEVEHVA